jgi:hypothetical protein
VLVGVNYKTVGRWLNSSVDVSEESVRAVARALSIAPMDLLTRVGYYSAADLQLPQAPTRAEIVADPAIQAIESSEVPPRVKAKMRQRLHELREAQRQREVDEVKWWIDQARGA